MSNNELMRDKTVPEPETGTATNIMTRRDMRQAIVKITFVPRAGKLPPVRARRFAFPTSVLATEFIQTVKPPPGAQLGSPKQYRAKIARLLRLTDPSVINKYELHCEMEITGPEGAGEDTGVLIDDNDEPLDTFVEGQTSDTPEPVDVESILNEVDETKTEIEFPE